MLLIESDRTIAEHIASHLRSYGHDVEKCFTGPDGEAKAHLGGHHAIILEVALPGKDGPNVVRTLRRNGLRTPILFLSILASVTDRVRGLECGGDDYMTKPFAAAELVARLNAITRRSTGRPHILKFGRLEMDLVRRTLKCDEQLIELQPQEFHLMEYLMLNAGRVVTRAMLLENVWNLTFVPSTNLVETQMSRLRSKIGCKTRNELIRTIRGSGYMFGR